MKTIIILGPTGVGKTDLSFTLASLLRNYLILSADSKQVYREQNIVTGKEIGKLQTYGIDLVNPDEDWSVSHFLTYAKKIIALAQSEGKGLIIVGGTGMYIDSLISPPKTASVPINQTLRSMLESLTVTKLQEKLISLNSLRLKNMNNSDANNPRRLIRAIEVALNNVPETISTPLVSSPLIIGLNADPKVLSARIYARVELRLELGAIEETKALHDKYPHWKSQAHAAIGYSEIDAYLAGDISLNELKSLWALHEKQYAKRQLTWWNNHLNIQWFDITKDRYKDDILKICHLFELSSL